MSEHESREPQLDKTYVPANIEDKWYQRWKAEGLFHMEPEQGRPNYCITIPPPNITGSLHMGHALNNSILDTLTRWHRMRGFTTLCLPGTDHAGIATQNMVEKSLATQNTDRHSLGRERFIEKCWEWREQYGKRIYFQFEKLGCSYDWDRVRFTMDESYVSAIHEQFKNWFHRGLIYRGTRVVNWDVKFQSAISDIEVVTQERKSSLYHFRYPMADASGYITIATTRPETMLGDAAVAANPDDDRYQSLFGATLRLPLTNRTIPLIADNYARPEFGSGAVKVTPAHDLNDFECGLRHNLPQIVVIGKDGRMTDAAGPDFVGLDRFEARKKVVAEMDKLGLLEKIEDYTIQTPVSDRSGEVVEPLLSEQWFVDMKPLARPAIEAVEKGLITFHPERYQAIYLRWMNNIRDWCISRQLWWGHRIPVWWTDVPGNTVELAAEEGPRAYGARRYTYAASREEAQIKLGTTDCWQDEDVLDTWFSSALWPHATLGWPKNTDDLLAFYPTDLLSTAQEILYLWVARMVMTGLDFVHRPAAITDDKDGLLLEDGITRAIIPFRDVYVHATVLDAKGERMSKSKGNGIDPIDLIDRHGADATRLSLLQQAGKNQDIRFSEQRTDIAGNFCTKLWNASRFVMMNLDDSTTGVLPQIEALTSADKWILHRLNETIDQVNTFLATYDMDDAVRAAQTFFWNDYCDWYVEIAKVSIRGTDSSRNTNTRNVLSFVLETTLRLLHPMIPFITEEIWQYLPHEPAPSISVAPYPTTNLSLHNAAAAGVMEIVIDAVRAIRNLRASLSIPPSLRVEGLAKAEKEQTHTALAEASNIVRELARLSEFSVEHGQQTGKWVAAPIAGGEVRIEIGAALDIPRELERVDKELAVVEKQLTRSRGMLSNEQFLARASAEVVDKERAAFADWQEKHARLAEHRKLLAGG